MSRVLIADDEESMRLLVARAIAMDGHDIVTAQDGAEALDILTREAGAFDLLLTDIQMPVMDGIALALTAARDFPKLTISSARFSQSSGRFDPLAWRRAAACSCVQRKKSSS